MTPESESEQNEDTSQVRRGKKRRHKRKTLPATLTEDEIPEEFRRRGKGRWRKGSKRKQNTD